ncbi:hypothetical protein [Lacticaseibacillus porcinae]|uniref:hypothetical protein n=1 Tax=Lacticaseibacillus porcinae TaxID=1123687 RepID=UPI000F7744A7|nr:hypothetical protein [Lacticaseibacillus porcinae]
MNANSYLNQAYAQGTHADDDGSLMVLSQRPFGDSRFKGNQRKGMVYTKFGDQVFERCVKLDDHRDRQRHFKPEYDFQYPSISEVITAYLTNNFHHEAFLSRLSYSFEVIQEHGRQITGSSAPNFLGDDGLEVILANDSPNPEIYEHYAVTMEEFAHNVADCGDNQQTLLHLIDYYQRYGVSPEHAKRFLVQQAGFDLLVGNTDRKQNMGNFVMIQRLNGLVHPLNFDYGRCLPMYWTDRINAQFGSGKLQLGEVELEQDYANDVIRTRGGIFGNRTRFEDNVKELLNNGFMPFQIDHRTLTNRLNDLCEEVQFKAPQLYWYARTKANVLLRVLADPKTQALWEDCSASDL